MEKINPFYVSFYNRHLEPLDTLSRISEIIFGLIMVLTFTCSIGAATAGREEIGTMLWGALGCNTAWGIIDAFFILMASIFMRGEGLSQLHKHRQAKSTVEAYAIIKEAMPPLLREIIQQDQLAEMHKKLVQLPEPPKRVVFTFQDFKNACMVFFLVFVSTFPVALPFILIEESWLALRVSNAIALILLFISGVILGKKTGYNSILMGLVFALIGSVLVSITMYLGG